MAYVDRWNASQLLGKKTYWLLDIEYAGKTYRLAQYELDVTSTIWGDLHYSASITSDIIFTSDFSLFSDTIDRTSVKVETFFENDDIVSLISKGHDLFGAPATLSKWIDGEDYDNRRIFLKGRLSDPQYGGNNIPVSFSIEDNFFDQVDDLIPNSNLIATERNVDVQYLDLEDIGLPYPIVIGNPGKIFDRDSTNDVMKAAGSQGVWISKQDQRQELIIAGHETNITSVYLISDEYTSGLPYITLNTIDLSGNQITVIPHGRGQTASDGVEQGIASATAASYFKAIYDPADSANNLDKKVFICWAPGGATTINTDFGGGLVQNGELVVGAGDVLKYILQQSKTNVDLGKVASAVESLNKFKIDCTIDAQVKPWEWVRANMLPILPISLASGINGTYFIVWDSNTVEKDVLASIDCDSDSEIEFAQIIDTDTSKIANDISIDYCLDIRSDQYQKSLEIDADFSKLKATGKILGTGNQYILLHSTKNGKEGDGIVVTVTSGMALAVSEDLYNKTVRLEVPAVASSIYLTDLVEIINTTLTSITAYLMGGTVAYKIDGFIPSSGGETNGVAQTLTLHNINVEPSIYCDLSQRRYSKITKNGIFKKNIKTQVIYKQDTASMILGWQSKAFAFPHKTVEAIMPENRYGWLERGNTVTLTCSRLGLSSKIAFIQSIEYGSDGMVAMRFTMIEDPIRDSR